MDARGTYRRYVAIGDSFTEGLVDPSYRPDGSFRGWADRLAEALDADAAAAGHRLEYANLAIRGRLLDAVITEQLPVAVASGADLFSFAAGGNDLLRPRTDVEVLAARVDNAVTALRATGADVLLSTGFDPAGLPVVGWVRSRAARYNLALWSIARRHGAVVLDLWTLRALYDTRMWAADRIHLSAEGHRRVALAAHATLTRAHVGPDAEWSLPLPAADPVPRRVALRADALWARDHLAPWVRRRLTHRSSGDGLAPKRAAASLVEAAGGLDAAEGGAGRDADQ